MKVELTGKLIKVGKAEKKGDKFTLQEIVVEETVDYNGTSKQVPIVFQVAKSQLEYASKWVVGSEVEVKANVSGRIWTSPEGETKYFNTIEAFYVKQIGNAMANARPQEAVNQEDSNPLPF